MSKNILIVDDAVFMRTILKNMLEKAGYIVVADAENGKKAVEKYKELYNTEKKPNLVLMDITMPEMDGITALKELKKFDEKVLVVMCSSLTAQHSVVEAIKVGAKHFIGKPFVEEDVIKTIEKVISQN
jgi:two-component system chemotaxis response regulator CheY